MSVILVPWKCDATAYRDEGEADTPSSMIVLYDDDNVLERLPNYVPLCSTYTPHFLTHTPPQYYSSRMEVYDFMQRMINDYKTFVDAVYNEVDHCCVTTRRVGVIDLCLHAGQYVDARKQAMLAFLLKRYFGNRKLAWETMLAWYGDEAFLEDNVWDMSDLYRHWIMPALENTYHISPISSSSSSDNEENNDSGIDINDDCPPSPISQNSP